MSLRNMVSNLEDQLKQTTAQLSMAKDSALELEAEVNKVQLTADQANRTTEDMERRLNRRAGELQASEEKCAQLERRLGKTVIPQGGSSSKPTLRVMAKLFVSTPNIVVNYFRSKASLSFNIARNNCIMRITGSIAGRGMSLGISGPPQKK